MHTTSFSNSVYSTFQKNFSSLGFPQSAFSVGTRTDTLKLRTKKINNKKTILHISLTQASLHAALLCLFLGLCSSNDTHLIPSLLLHITHAIINDTHHIYSHTQKQTAFI